MAAIITINDILEIETHAHSLLDKATKMRRMLENEQKVTKRKQKDAEVFARAEARFNRTMLRGRARLEANKKTDQ